MGHRTDPAPAAADNPFAHERTERLRYRHPDTDWIELLDRFESSGWEGAVEGPAGSGKTTFLTGLAQALQEDGFGIVRLQLDRARRDRFGIQLRGLARRVRPDDIVLADDTDELGLWAWRRLRRIGRRGAGLVVTARTSTGLPRLLTCRPSPRLLEELIVDLLPWGPRPSATAVRRLFLGSGGDLRVALDALRERYDQDCREQPVFPRSGAGVAH